MDVAHEVNLDVSHLHAAKITTETVAGDFVAPDVLVVPSRYKQFVKVMSSVYAVKIVVLIGPSRMLTIRWPSIHRLRRREW